MNIPLIIFKCPEHHADAVIPLLLSSRPFASPYHSSPIPTRSPSTTAKSTRRPKRSSTRHPRTPRRPRTHLRRKAPRHLEVRRHSSRRRERHTHRHTPWSPGRTSGVGREGREGHTAAAGWRDETWSAWARGTAHGEGGWWHASCVSGELAIHEVRGINEDGGY